MAETVTDAAGGDDAVVLGNGYGGFVALQMAIRHPGIATRLVLADCGAVFSEPGREAFRNMATASKGKGLAGDHRCRDAPAVRTGIPGAASGFDARPPRGIPANRSGGISSRPATRWPNSTSGPNWRWSRCRRWYWSASMTRRHRHRCPANWPQACRPRSSRSLRAAPMFRRCNRPRPFSRRSRTFCGLNQAPAIVSGNTTSISVPECVPVLIWNWARLASTSALVSERLTPDPSNA